MKTLVLLYVLLDPGMRQQAVDIETMPSMQACELARVMLIQKTASRWNGRVHPDNAFCIEVPLFDMPGEL